MDLMLQGLTLSLTGLVITFASLGLFILIIIVLQRIFGANGDAPSAAGSQASSVRVDTVGSGVDSQVAAAIAIAIEHFRTTDDQTGSALTQGHGAWWHARQIQTPSVRRPSTK